jgi:hypothetical protein
MRNTKKLKDLSPPQRVAAVVALIISLGLVATAQRDLQRRPEDEVRGNKWVWRLVCLNALGALTYLLWARLPGNAQ